MGEVIIVIVIITTTTSINIIIIITITWSVTLSMLHPTQAELELERVQSEERLVGEAMELEVDKFEKEKIEDVKVQGGLIPAFKANLKNQAKVI